MELIENLNKEEYENFVLKNYKSHFLQSYIWGVLKEKTSNFIPHYIGIKDNNKLICTLLLLEKKLPLNYRYFYCPRGFITNYNDKNLLKEITNLLKKYLKNNNGLFIKIDPDIKLHDLDINGNILDNNNYELVKYLMSLGYIHQGYNKNFEKNQPRYTFRLDISKGIDYVTNNFHPTTKKIVKKGNPFELELYKNEDSSIDDFYLTMMETAKRENVVYYDKAYFKKFYEILHKENMCDLYVVKANINRIKEIYNDKKEVLLKKIDSFKEKNDIKNINKKNEFINQLNKVNKEINELKNINQEKLVLSSIMTVKYKDTVWTLHGGNHSLLRELNSNYFIYYEIIKDAIKEGYKRMDFFGTTGNPTKDNPVYGIHLFKERLGGEYTEFIGEFDLVNNKLMYFIYTKLIKIRHKIQRKRYMRKDK